MTVRRASTRWRIVAVLAATAGVFGAWLFLHLPATHAAEWVIARIGFPRYERSLRIATIAGACLTFAVIWVRERSFAGPSGRSALLLLGFVAFGEAALMVAPVEHVHFPQYALIAAMIWLAGAAPERAWAAATVLGAADEAYQLLFLRSGRPDYFDWNDVFLNAVGAAYGVLIMTAGSTRAAGRFLTKKTVCALMLVAAAAACVIQPPDVTPYWTLTPRGRQFRILSAVEAIGLLGLLWWTLRRRFVTIDDAASTREAPGAAQAAPALQSAAETDATATPSTRQS